MENILERTAGYVYHKLVEYLKDIDTSKTALVVDAAGHLGSLIPVVKPGIAMELASSSDVIEAWLSNTDQELADRLISLQALSMEEYPHQIFTAQDIYDLLNLPEMPVAPTTFLPSIEAYKSALSAILQANQSTVIAYRNFIKATRNALALRVVSALVARGFHKLVYFGAYPSWISIPEARELIDISCIPIAPEDLKLMQLAYTDIKGGTPVFYDEYGHIIWKNGDMAANSKAQDSVFAMVNLAVDPSNIYRLPETPNASAQELYRELLARFELTNYNFTTTAVKNIRFNTRALDETVNVGDYSLEHAHADQAAINIANYSTLPEAITDEYSRLPEATPADTVCLAVGISAYNIPAAVLSSRLAELENDTAVDVVLVAHNEEVILQAYSKARAVSPQKAGYAATVNAIALAALQLNASHFIMNDCTDTVTPSFFAHVRAAVVGFPGADVVSFKSTCVGDLRLVAEPLDPCRELFSVLYATSYVNLAAMVFKPYVFQTVAMDEDLKYNAQYEFLFRLVLAGADFETSTKADLFHTYSFGQGKHMQDKLHYEDYRSYIKSKHAAAIAFAEALKVSYDETIARNKALQHDAASAEVLS